MDAGEVGKNRLFPVAPVFLEQKSTSIERRLLRQRPVISPDAALFMLANALVIGHHITQRRRVVDYVVPSRLAAADLARKPVQREVRGKPRRVDKIVRYFW